jgi:hypothetical protein
MSVYPSGNVYPPIAIPPHTHSRSDITDLFSSPFWNNIPDKPSAFTPSAHASSHLKGGADEVLNLSNINAAVGFSIDAHASRHVKGGADEVLNLTNVNSAVGFDVSAHASRHLKGAIDEVLNLTNLNAAAGFSLEGHASRHVKGGADEVLNLTNINNAIGFSVDAHASRHRQGGADEAVGVVLQGTTLPTAGVAGRFFLKTDVLEFYYDNGTSWVKVGKLAGLDLDAHASRHDIGGADQIPGLASHKSRHLKGGADEVLNLTNINSAVGFDLSAHASRHAAGGADALSLDASQIASGRLTLSRLPDGPSGQAIVGKGAGVDPAWGSVSDAFARQLVLSSALVIPPWILPESIEPTHLSGSLKSLITWMYAPGRITSDVVIPSGCSYGRPRSLIVDSGGRLEVDGAFAVY